MPLRELLLVATVLLLSVWGLFQPRISLYGFLWFSLMRPDELSWSAGRYPYATVLAAVTLIGGLRFLPHVSGLLRNPIIQWLLLLQVPIAVSVVLCEGPFLSADRYTEYLRAILMALLIPVLLTSVEHLRQLLLVIAISLGGLGLKFGLFGIIHGGTLFTQGLGLQYDNNTLGLALAMAVPICWYSRDLVRSSFGKLTFLAMVLTSSATVVMTNSRGASLALAGALFCIVYRSRHKFLVLGLIALLVAPSIYLVKDQYLARMSTLTDYKADSSAASRFEYARAAIAMWSDYPICGVGFGARNYVALNAKYLGREDNHGAHNTYLQMLVDSGLFAYLLYTGLLFGTIVWLARSVKQVRLEAPGLESIPAGLQVALIAFAVGGTFGSMQRYDFLYMLLMAAAAWAGAQPDARQAAGDADTTEPFLGVVDGSVSHLERTVCE